MQPIDFVITWVDGSDPRLAEKRNKYQKITKKIEKVSYAKRRFSDNNEISFCLKSMFKYAPWVRKVWIITDGQTPKCLSEASIEPYLNKIEIVDHSEIFSNYENCLPTFSSLSIETFLWGISGLSECFVYFNDDMFLTNNVSPYHFFKKGMPVLRGTWGEWLDIEELSFHGANRQLGAEYTPFRNNEVFRSAHAFHPLKKSVMKALYLSMKNEFRKNASFRFRSRKQFWSISLHDHILLSSGACTVKKGAKDWVHFSVAFCKTAEPEAIAEKVNLLKGSAIVGCLNYIEAIEKKYPNIYSLLEEITE